MFLGIWMRKPCRQMTRGKTRMVAIIFVTFENLSWKKASLRARSLAILDGKEVEKGDEDSDNDRC